jgi:hypothetical protein
LLAGFLRIVSGDWNNLKNNCITKDKIAALEWLVLCKWLIASVIIFGPFLALLIPKFVVAGFACQNL